MIANRITPACPYIFPSARRRSGMVARQVRRSVVMSNLQIRLLPMDSDRTPLGKGKNVLHGAVRAAPLEHSVEQPCAKGAVDRAREVAPSMVFWPQWRQKSLQRPDRSFPFSLGLAMGCLRQCALDL